MNIVKSVKSVVNLNQWQISGKSGRIRLNCDSETRRILCKFSSPDPSPSIETIKPPLLVISSFLKSGLCLCRSVVEVVIVVIDMQRRRRKLANLCLGKLAQQSVLYSPFRSQSLNFDFATDPWNFNGFISLRKLRNERQHPALWKLTQVLSVDLIIIDRSRGGASTHLFTVSSNSCDWRVPN